MRDRQELGTATISCPKCCETQKKAFKGFKVK